MSTRTTARRQCEGQLWLTFEWPKPTDHVRVSCTACGWTGRRMRRTATRRPCPQCARPVRRGVFGSRPASVLGDQLRDELRGLLPERRQRAG
jgi:hypothetical protein